jgi:hypothetical protein
LPKPDQNKEFRYECAYFYGQVPVGEIEVPDEFKKLHQKALKRQEAVIKVTKNCNLNISISQKIKCSSA